MKISSTSKVVAAVVGFTMALTVFAAVGASTASAQAMSLSDLVNLFISLGIIAPDKAAAAKAAVTSAPATATTFTKDLTIGSSGAEVTALQEKLGVTPATGYFGSLTKAAVVKYQKENGINATGFVGPLTRASLNKGAVVSTPVVNSGVEGILTVDKASISNSTVYEGNTMHTVLGLKVQAKLSDIALQRVKIDLGTTTTIYTKVFKTAYLTDDSGKVLAQADLNSNTVVKDNSRYYLTFGGFSYTVPKDSTKYLYVKVDAYASIKDADRYVRTITLANDGVRGTDGAGIDQYAGGTSVAQNISLSSSLVDSASVDLSVNSANYKSSEVVAADGADNNELDGLPVLAFDARANKSDVKITDLEVTITKSGSGAAYANTAYLYDGSTLIQQESVSSNKAVFSDVDNLVVSKDSTKTLTVKIDVRGADATSASFVASVSSVTAENSQGSEARASGTPAGESFSVRNVGPVFTLVGNPVAGTVSKNSDQNGNATTTLPVTFNIQVTAKGADVTFNSNPAHANAFIKADYIDIYKNGTKVTSSSEIVASSTVFDMPSSGVTTDGTAFTLAKNNTITLAPQAKITVVGSSAGANNYALGINALGWSATGATNVTSTFMAGKTEWRNSSVALP